MKKIGVVLGLLCIVVALALLWMPSLVTSRGTMVEDPGEHAQFATSFAIPRVIHLKLLDPAPPARLAALKQLLVDMGPLLAAQGQDGEARAHSVGSLDRGLIEVSEPRADRTYVVEFAIVFPVATLDTPEVTTVDLISRVVRWPGRGGHRSAETARDAAFARLLEALAQSTAPGTPLSGRVEIAPR